MPPADNLPAPEAVHQPNFGGRIIHDEHFFLHGITPGVIRQGKLHDSGHKRPLALNFELIVSAVLNY